MTEASYNRLPTENKNSVYSVGTAIAIDSFEKNYIKYRYNVVAINIGTLIRNHIDKDNSYLDIQSNVLTELPVLLNEITQIINKSPPNLTPLIFLYAIDYPKCINEVLIREATEYRNILYKNIKYFISHSSRIFGEHQKGTFNNINVVFKEITQGEPSIYKILSNKIKHEISPVNVILISHMAIEFHIYRYVNNLILLESHTGEWKDTNSFSKKVFGNNYKEIPFIPATHLCFGDKDLISPALSVKQKKELLEIANKNTWKIRSSQYIRDFIKSKYSIPASIIRQLGD
jgi:hypothetical protein